MKTRATVILAVVGFLLLSAWLSARGADDSAFRRQIQSTTFTRDLLVATNASDARTKLGIVSGQDATAATPTIADLLAIEVDAFDAEVTPTYMVLGYNTAGDGGGGDFYWDSASTAATNLGTVFAVDGVATGRWIRVEWDGDVRAFGVMPGTTNTIGIQAALDGAYNDGKKVFFPAGTYAIDGPITNWSGVTIEGKGATINRRFWIPNGNPATGAFDSSKRHAIQLAPGSIVRGLTIDGGADQTTIATFGVDGAPGFPWMNTSGVLNQTQYGDVVPLDGPYVYAASGITETTEDADEAGGPGSMTTIIENCTFRNSPGSCIKNQESAARGVVVRNCTFLGYYDHAWYFTGWPALSGTNLPVGDLIFTGNKVSVANQTRANTALKLRNLVNRTVISENTFYLTNDIAISLDAGDTTGGNGALGPVVIANNVGTTRYFVAMDDASTNLLNSWQVLIEGNNISIHNDGVTGYLLGVNPAQRGPSGVGVMRGNVFRTADEDSIAYLLLAGYQTPESLNRPTTYVLEDNVFDGLFLIQPYGTIQLSVERNKWYDRRGPSTNNFPFVVNVATPTPNYLPASGTIPWTFVDNTFINFATVIFDSDSAVGENGNNLIAGHTLYMNRNMVVGHPLRGWLLDWRGTNIADYSGSNRVIAKDNVAASVLGSFNTLPQSLILESFNTTETQTSGLVYKSPSVVFGNTNQQTDLNVNAGSANVGRLNFMVDGVIRQEIRRTTTSDLQMIRRDASGVSLSTPIWVDADNGFVGINDKTDPSTELDVRGDITMGKSTTSNQYLTLLAAQQFDRMIRYTSQRTNRWDVGANRTSETGSDAGSDFDFRAYDDTGATSNTVARLSRAAVTGSTQLELLFNGSLRRVGVTNVGGNDLLYLEP